jgi:signal transduction histidine kinase
VVFSNRRDAPGWLLWSALAVVTVVAGGAVAAQPTGARIAAGAALTVFTAVALFGPGRVWWIALLLAVAAAMALVGDNSASVALIAVFGLPGLAGYLGSRAQSVVVLVPCLAFLGLHAAHDLVHHDSTGWYLSAAGTLVSWAVGRVVQRQEATVAALQGAQSELAHRAAAEERQRIARDVHDLVGHSLSVTLLHLTGARMALDVDPEAARRALVEAERLGRETMTEIRQTVGLLSVRDGESPRPLPLATDIAALVEQFRRGGLHISCESRGDLGATSAPVGVAAYRIVQESLSNVAKHAPGAHTMVSVDAAGGRLHLSVNSRPAPAEPPGEPGRGIVGMTERAELLGGALFAGQRDGGWLVEAVLPAGHPAAPQSVGT